MYVVALFALHLLVPRIGCDVGLIPAPPRAERQRVIPPILESF